MSLRLRNRWKQGDRARTLEDIATVSAANAWRVACNGVLNLENEEFETRTQYQRLDVIEEFVIFLLHLTDHQVYGKFSEDERARFVTAMALRLAGLVEENRADNRPPEDQIGRTPEDYRRAFIDKINERNAVYAECRYSPVEGPGFGLLRAFAEWVSEALGPTNRQWAIDQVVAIDGPEAVEKYTASLDALLAGSDDRSGPGKEGPVRPMAED